MTTLDFTQIVLQQLITHHVGNKLRDEKYILSNESTTIEDETQKFLLKYFLLPVKAEEFYSFTHPVKLELNDIYSVVENVFSNQHLFIPSSQNIAKLLYEQSMHPKIREGELNIAYFSNVVLIDEVVDAIGIFKSETNVPFIKMKNNNSKFNINHDFGFEIKGMDKGCIIFNTNKQDGYKILIIDNTNKTAEAQYWKDDFLKVKPIANEFYQTSQFLGIAKNFITKVLPQQFETTKADQIDLLNKSVQFFKEKDNFDIQEFASEVISQPEIIESFNRFKQKYKQEQNIELSDQFIISDSAVKKQTRVFKSVIKLDKNFHIYIHGNHQLIEQGVDEEGRKFYKIYYQTEY